MENCCVYADHKYGFSSVQSLSCVWLFEAPWTIACQVSLSITNSQNLLKLMSIESVMPSNHLILCHPLLLLPSIFPSFNPQIVFLISFFWWCHMACGILVPRPGIEPMPPAMEALGGWQFSRSVVSNSLWPHGLQPIRLLCPWDFPGKSTGVGCYFLQGNFPTQELNLGLLRCRQIFFFNHLSHQGSPESWGRKELDTTEWLTLPLFFIMIELIHILK